MFASKVNSPWEYIELWNKVSSELDSPCLCVQHDVAYGSMKGPAARSWVMASDLEKAAHHGASSSGESLATGGILSVNLLKVGSAAASPSRAYINCLYDAVAELKDSGCFVYS